MAEAGVERRLTTILAADIFGYSHLMGMDEAGTLSALTKHRRDLIDPKAAQYGGRTVKLMGDGTLMEFASVVDAVAFAVEVQTAMQERNAGIPEDRQIVYRIGINVGDIIVEGDDIYGDGVNVAARLEGLAEPGGICIPHRTRPPGRFRNALARRSLRRRYCGSRKRHCSQSQRLSRLRRDGRGFDLRHFRLERGEWGTTMMMRSPRTVHLPPDLRQTVSVSFQAYIFSFTPNPALRQRCPGQPLLNTHSGSRTFLSHSFVTASDWEIVRQSGSFY